METKNVGHWSDGNTAGCFESSYQLMPLLDTLVKMAGSPSVAEYRSFWSAITPPSSLTELVLTSFAKPCAEAREVRFLMQQFMHFELSNKRNVLRDYSWQRKLKPSKRESFYLTSRLRISANS